MVLARRVHLSIITCHHRMFLTMAINTTKLHNTMEHRLVLMVIRVTPNLLTGPQLNSSMDLRKLILNSFLDPQPNNNMVLPNKGTLNSAAAPPLSSMGLLTQTLNLAMDLQISSNTLGHRKGTSRLVMDLRLSSSMALHPKTIPNIATGLPLNSSTAVRLRVILRAILSLATDSRTSSNTAQHHKAILSSPMLNSNSSMVDPRVILNMVMPLLFNSHNHTMLHLQMAFSVKTQDMPVLVVRTAMVLAQMHSTTKIRPRLKISNYLSTIATSLSKVLQLPN
jgi:hypothetical protein